MSGLKKILIVEDEYSISKALDIKLNNSGFNTKIVNNGHEAMKVLEKENFDLIILDIIMPRMDGFSTLKEISKRKIKTKVIVLSNLDDDSDVRTAKKFGVAKYLRKSEISLSETVDYIKKLLN